MKKLFYIICSAAVLFGCTPTSNNSIDFSDYEGNQVKVTLSSDAAIPAEGGSVTATVSTNMDFDVRIPEKDSWLTFSRADSVLTFTASANTASTLRYTSAAIVDTERDIIMTRIEIQQAGTEKEVVKKTFSVSPTSISVDADKTSSSFSVSGDVSWTVKSDNASFVPSPVSGSGNGTVTVSFPANTNTESEVTANLTVSTEDDAYVTSYTVTITQAKAKAAGLDPVKPAAGTVLAEWEFETAQIENLRKGGIESVSLDDDNKPGNVGDPYFNSQVSGNGKLEYFNGSDKSAYSTKKHKRRVGTRGEPCIYGTWVNDYILWSAPTESGAPLAAGTKIKLNFALRPNGAGVMRDWKCEVLDGEEWKELEGVTLQYNPSGNKTLENPTEINAIIVRSYTLTKNTEKAAFRFTCTSQVNSAGSEISELVKGDALRFAGKFLEAATDYELNLQVPENPKIMVVE